MSSFIQLLTGSNTLKAFFKGFFTVIIIGTIPLFLMKKGELLLLVNAKCTPFLDQFFQNFTHLGLGVVMAILAVVFLFIRYYYSILFSAGLISAGLTSLICKEYIFSSCYRPAMVVGLKNFHHVMEGFDYSYTGSFPSGHTFTAFSTAFILSLYSKHQFMGIFWLTLASLVGFSRMYIMQHFYMDVYTGALLGTTITLLLHYLLGAKQGWSTSPKINGNLIDYFNRKKRIT